MARSLLERVAAGEPGSVSECIDHFGGLVWSLARRLAPEDADDAVQEIFVDVWKSAPRFDPRVASETTFVAMIARRRLIDRRRRLGRQPVPAPLPDDPALAADSAPASPQEGPAICEEAAAANRALATLTPEQQRVIRLAVYQSLSHEQISRATGLPLGTVKTHIRRGLIRVRELLEKTQVGAESEARS